MVIKSDLLKFKHITACLIAWAVLCYACKTKVFPGSPEKNGNLLVTFKRTACFGKCPTYDVNIYANGLLTYHGIRFTELEGNYYATLSKSELEDIQRRFKDAGFEKFEVSYPPPGEAPPDLPSCVIVYGGKSVKTKWGKYPAALASLQTYLDSLWQSKKLQKYDQP
ncbi:MAG: DUF6438 domain-containing protein [Chitinophagales bacterium]|nr:DUF6438 domain-containing protein [Chitinophagales bacterium]MDW8420134.1 DUF6438 domain-containing protein [Chitinophagales bacterium]